FIESSIEPSAAQLVTVNGVVTRYPSFDGVCTLLSSARSARVIFPSAKQAAFRRCQAPVRITWVSLSKYWQHSKASLTAWIPLSGERSARARNATLDF